MAEYDKIDDRSGVERKHSASRELEELQKELSGLTSDMNHFLARLGAVMRPEEEELGEDRPHAIDPESSDMIRSIRHAKSQIGNLATKVALANARLQL